MGRRAAVAEIDGCYGAVDFLDWTHGSHGFHAPQEAARVLAESIDYARQGGRVVAERYGARLDRAAVDIMPVEGVTPDSLAQRARDRPCPVPCKGADA